jgi:Protein of unknown function (DUF2863)
MKRPPYGSRPRLSKEMAQLSWLAIGLAQAGSRLERTHWRNRLEHLVQQLLSTGDDEALNSVLNRLSESEPIAHDALIDTIESSVESSQQLIQGIEQDVLLIACPILAWSRYAIPVPILGTKEQSTIETLLKATVLTRHANVALLGMLVGPDQIPREYSELWQLTRTIAASMTTGLSAPLHNQASEVTNRFLSDTRYLIAVVSVPHNEAIFRWQEPYTFGTARQMNARSEILTIWSQEFLKIIEPMLAGCKLTTMLPDAFHAACISADRASRSYSIESSVQFLNEVLNLPPEKQRAVIGPFYAPKLEEYRIGFGPRNQDVLFHGVVWPLLGIEDDQVDMAAEIEQVLQASGVTDIVVHNCRFPMEYCEDCSSPMYANSEGELVHLEPPESAATETNILH